MTSATIDMDQSSSRSSNIGVDASEKDLDARALTASLAKDETRAVSILRAVVLLVLILAAVLASVGVYLYTAGDETEAFESTFQDSAHQVITNFHRAVERNIGAAAAFSNQLTAHAIESNSSFPFVSLPHFVVRGSDARAQSGSHLLFWTPLVTDQTRNEWEDYLLERRFMATEAFELDEEYRIQQDVELALQNNNTQERRYLQEDSTSSSPPLTVMDDGTNYHPKIWSPGARTPLGDEPQGDGTQQYLPVWQQSPVDPTVQAQLNVNIAGINVITPGILDIMQAQPQAVLNHAAPPIPAYKEYFEQLLLLSQYRDNVEERDGMHTMLSYPVFDSFDSDTRQFVGMVNTDVYWDVLLTGVLPSNLNGVNVVIHNSAGQTFSYRLEASVDGDSRATFLGLQDPDSEEMTEGPYDHMVVSANVNNFLKEFRNGPENKAYKTVPLSDAMQYTMRVYPGQSTADQFITEKPLVYTIITLVVFLFAATMFLVYSYVVERRQRIMTDKVIEHVKKAMETERELNEFLSHEVRNPLSAAISAMTFVSTAVHEAEPLKDEDTRKIVREDVEVVSSSLHFINDFLRSMLDIYQASGNKIRCAMAPTDILQDIFEPVSNILYKRLANFEVLVDCPPNLVVMTDSIRLKQVVLNLVRNASKFVEKGFLRMRAAVVNNKVKLFIEDSGPGIDAEKKKAMFARYQESLDRLSQGTGIGLNLSKKLMRIMKGDLYLDDDYDSGIEGCPGACFVIDLKTPPLDIDSAMTIDASARDWRPVDVESGLAELHVAEIPPEKALDEGHTSQSTAVESLEPTQDGYHQPKKPPGETSVTPNGNINQPVTHPLDEESALPEGLSVLFTDDDTMLRKLFMRAVKRVAPPSWNIQDAASGETALKLCETCQFDLVFMDQYMASVDKTMLGTETVTAMRAKGVKSKVCGLSANDLRDAFINAGADDFVLKPMPCKTPELKKLLMRILFQSNGIHDYVASHKDGGKESVGV